MSVRGSAFWPETTEKQERSIYMAPATLCRRPSAASFWQRGYGDPPPETLIVLGISRGFLERSFHSCEVAGHTPNPYGIENEETSDHPDIYVCRGLRQSWPEFWKDFRYYG